MNGGSVDYVIMDEFARNPKDWAIKYWTGEYYDNNNSKGKKMNDVYQVLAIQEFVDGSPLPKILVPITTVVAKDEDTARQNFTVDNAETLKGKDGVLIQSRLFC